jgi:hypothetical protein
VSRRHQEGSNAGGRGGEQQLGRRMRVNLKSKLECLLCANADKMGVGDVEVEGVDRFIE